MFRNTVHLCTCKIKSEWAAAVKAHRRCGHAAVVTSGLESTSNPWHRAKTNRPMATVLTSTSPENQVSLRSSCTCGGSQVVPYGLHIKHYIIRNICKVSLLCSAVCKVSLLFSALYAKCTYTLVLYMQSVLTTLRIKLQAESCPFLRQMTKSC